MREYQKKINIFSKNHIDPISESELKKTWKKGKIGAGFIRMGNWLG